MPMSAVFSICTARCTFTLGNWSRAVRVTDYYSQNFLKVRSRVLIDIFIRYQALVTVFQEIVSSFDMSFYFSDEKDDERSLNWIIRSSKKSIYRLVNIFFENYIIKI